MQLSEYLQSTGEDIPSFAKRIKRDVSTVYRIINKQVMPSRATMHAISKATDGKVTPNDLLDAA
jgi:DNA-binding transcriptional regulator YdaS (Cro superfamily)